MLPFSYDWKCVNNTVKVRECSLYLNEEVEVATVIVVADGGVAPGDVFTINFSRYGNVLADRKAENVLRVWQGETVAEGLRVYKGKLVARK
jgi:hypothetical protein